MGKLKKSIVSSVICILLSIPTIGQYSLGGGVSSISSLGIPNSRFGGNFFTEIPRDDVNTLFIRATFTLPTEEVGRTVFLNQISFDDGFQDVPPIDVYFRTGFFSVDGSNRRYVLNTYDAGVALFGGFNFRGIVMPSREVPKDFDTDVFEITEELKSNSNSLLLGVGFNGGAKYQLPYRGAINFDFSIEFVRRLIDQNALLGSQLSPIIFSMNLAYRFDRY